ncbi:HAD-IIIC family phosphatase [Streptantibioticus silvisoli]|uniref:HAD-IIIC family phosphatase n=1 Tax=Streptantibioticus silvisoli TaxID=2705255 RepID=A0ABT6W6H3_9ACTN|nr:HAD-IIIC family phosphatase [Streptantibioticus silvisoli]MDI5966356.1 HAD-IIIC family phosphatase [Streptantibioticus silvisoli]
MSTQSADAPAAGTPAAPPVKCVVWDLDNTLWSGVLLEDAEVTVRPGMAEAVRELDARGVLQSVASRNDPATATARLERAGLAGYFLVPRIGWGAKSESVRRIAADLNLGLDAFLFVDDDPFEREEVSGALPAVRTAEITGPHDVAALLARADLTPAVVTGDGARRRLMYQAEQRRSAAEEDFAGTPQEFLAGLGMRLAVRRAGPGDLARAEELTVRTHQLNATGYTYSHDELDALRSSDRHVLLVVDLADRFGDYGTVGLVLLEGDAPAGRETCWTLKLLLVSCRVMARGIGAVLLGHVIARSRERGVRLRGEFVPTDRNRMMLVSYRFAGFALAEERADGVAVYEYRAAPGAAAVPAVPDHLTMTSHL